MASTVDIVYAGCLQLIVMAELVSCETASYINNRVPSPSLQVHVSAVGTQMFTHPPAVQVVSVCEHVV